MNGIRDGCVGQHTSNNNSRLTNGNYEANMVNSLNKLNINGNQQVNNGSQRSDSNKASEKKPFDLRYEMLNRIGMGSYASVYKAYNREDGKIYAIKKISMTSEFPSLKNEIKILSECDNINIVRYLESDCSVSELSIVMEYCRGGSVKDVMKNLDRTLNYEQILVITRDALCGLEYLHSKGKIHRDVKAANILLQEDGIAKLGDFGVSEPFDTSRKKQSIIGTLLWLPPEVLNHSIESNHSSVIDIWSLGVTIIEMADGQPPYNDIDQNAAMSEIKDLSKPSPTLRGPNRWPKLLEFLELCLNKQAAERKSASELLKHEIFEDPNLSHEEIKTLVREVCLSPARAAELSSDLCRDCEKHMNELRHNLGIYKNRRKKVVMVDKMTESLRSVRESFRKLQADVKSGNDDIEKLTLDLASLKEEIVDLSAQRDVLRTKLADGKGRRESIRGQIQTIENRRRC